MNIEAYLREYLAEALEGEGVKVATEIPKEQYEKLVVFEQTGSTTNNCIVSTTIAIQSIADSRQAAALLNDRVKEAMAGFTSREEVARCELNSDYNFTDTQTKRNRYQAVFDIVYYA